MAAGAPDLFILSPTSDGALKLDAAVVIQLPEELSIGGHDEGPCATHTWAGMAPISSGDGGVSCLPCASEEGGLDPARAAQVDGPCANGEKAAGKRPVPAGPLETWPRKRPHSDQRTAGSNDGTQSHVAQSDEAAACDAPAVAKAGGLKQSDSKVHALLRGMRFLRD